MSLEGVVVQREERFWKREMAGQINAWRPRDTVSMLDDGTQ